MEFIEFVPNSTHYLVAYEDAKSIFKQNQPQKDYTTAIFDIAYGYVKRRPDAYLSLGVYWWAVKDVLQKQGYDVAGDIESPALVQTYSVKNPDGTVHPQATLVAAFDFRDWYFENYFEGNREFVINDDTGEIYTLTDDVFEQGFA